MGYLNVLHVCIVELLSEMLVLLQEINDFPEVAVIVKPGVLKKKVERGEVYIGFTCGL
jgi:hypothetical protein